MSKSKKISIPNELIMDAMSQVGSIKLAAEALNVSETSLRKRIGSDRQLKSLYIKESPSSPVPSDIEAMIREPKEPTSGQDKKLADAIQKMNSQLLNEGLRKAGISEETCNKLELFSKMDDNGWRMLIGGLDLMHRMLLYQAAALFQEAERCRGEELEDSETLINTYDRVLSGTLASVKMAESASPKKKSKPGFAALKEKPS